MFITSGNMTSPSVEQIPAGINAVEGYKASMNGDGLCIREHLPQIIERGAEALTPAEKELLKWIGVFFRKPTPGPRISSASAANARSGLPKSRFLASRLFRSLRHQLFAIHCQLLWPGRV